MAAWWSPRDRGIPSIEDKIVRFKDKDSHQVEDKLCAKGL